MKIKILLRYPNGDFLNWQYENLLRVTWILTLLQYSDEMRPWIWWFCVCVALTDIFIRTIISWLIPTDYYKPRESKKTT